MTDPKVKNPHIVIALTLADLTAIRDVLYWARDVYTNEGQRAHDTYHLFKAVGVPMREGFKAIHELCDFINSALNEVSDLPF